MRFGKLTIDAPIDAGALTNAISDKGSRNIRLLAPQTILNERPPPDLQIIVASGHLETSTAQIELQLKVGEFGTAFSKNGS